jgi:hypothetical protein
VDTPEDQRIRFRIGINLGDVILEDGDLFGDGVDIAAWRAWRKRRHRHVGHRM